MERLEEYLGHCVAMILDERSKKLILPRDFESPDDKQEYYDKLELLDEAAKLWLSAYDEVFLGVRSRYEV